MPTFPTVDTAGVNLPLPMLPIVENIKFNNLIVTFDSGHEQRRKKSAPYNTWELNYKFLRPLAYQRIYDFFKDRGGSLEAFTWVHPVTKVSYNVRFEEDVLRSDIVLKHAKLGLLRDMSIKLKEDL